MISYEQYHQKGGTYVIPVEVFDNLLDEYQELKEQYCERTDCSGRLGNSKKVEKLIKENQKYKEVIDKALNDIDLVIELIKQQPTEDDSWILGRLNSFKIILKEVE